MDAKKIIKQFKPTVVKTIKDDDDFGVAIKDVNSNLVFWVDVWGDLDNLQCDWNKQVFILTDENDVLRKEIQENTHIADICFSLACESVENNFNLK